MSALALFRSQTRAQVADGLGMVFIAALVVGFPIAVRWHLGLI